MSHLGSSQPLPIRNWDDFAEWVAKSLACLDRGDVFEIGPRNFEAGNEASIPCAQAVALQGAILLRLSTAPMGIPLLDSLSSEHVTLDVWHRSGLFEDCTFGHIVSADLDLLGQACVAWFRARCGMRLADLGCDLLSAKSLGGPRGIPPSERY